MSTTYGERVLADAEDRVQHRGRRRRLVFVFTPTVVASAAAMLDTIAVRNAAHSGGLIGDIAGATLVVAYVLVLLAVPLYLAVLPTPAAIPAGVAAVAGPIAMPLVFGVGWRWWQNAIVLVACVLVIAARLSQPRQARSRRARRR